MRLLVINTVSDPKLESVRRRNAGRVSHRPVIAGRPLPPRGRRVLKKDELTESTVNELERLASIGNVVVVEVGADRRDADFAKIREALGYTDPPVCLPPRKEGKHNLRENPSPALSGEPSMLVDLAHPEKGRELPFDPADQERRQEERAREGQWLLEDPFGQVRDVIAKTAESHVVPVEVLFPEETETAGAVQAFEFIERLHLQELCEDPARIPPPQTIEDALDPPVDEPLRKEEPEVSTNESFVQPPDVDALVRGSKNKTLVSVLAMFGKSGLGRSKAVLVGMVEACLSGDPDPVAANAAVALMREQG